MSHVMISEELVNAARERAMGEGRDLPTLIHELLRDYIVKDDCGCRCGHNRTLTWTEFLAILSPEERRQFEA